IRSATFISPSLGKRISSPFSFNELTAYFIRDARGDGVGCLVDNRSTGFSTLTGRLTMRYQKVIYLYPHLPSIR
ncbi:MAG: hypothetical protein ACTTKN_12370, partial [Phocaeicola sp.]|uniref:hypothetical protein n=1 Tax=Phocaeicola sp. TaxID=2773926 RepID=UPI003F9F89CE